MVLDHFTTLSPGNDGLDNDNADGDNNTTTNPDDDTETFVPGRININTVPLHNAVLAAPLPETIDDIQSLMNQVFDYRDNPSNRDIGASVGLTPLTGLRGEKGISSLGEILYINPKVVSSLGTITDATDMGHYGAVGLTGLSAQGALDIYPMLEAVATATPNTMAIEGAMARYQFLSQTFTTRSDIYTAYVEVRGYPAGDFRRGPIETKRFFVVYDRSNVKERSDRPRILAITEKN